MPHQFHSHWHIWKVLGQKNIQWYEKGVPARVPTPLFLSRVYRTGATALADWGVLDALRPATVGFDIVRGSQLVARKLQAEYLRSILRSDKMYTLPRDIADISDASMLSNAQASIGKEQERRSKHFLCFQIIDPHVATKRHLLTERWMEVRSMQLACTVQRYTLWQCDRPDPTKAVSVCIDGFPDVIDVMALAPWAALRVTLREWSFEEHTDLPYCLSLTNSSLTCEHEWDPRAKDTPALVVLEALLQEGWRAARKEKVPESHHLGVALRFLPCDFVQWKPYLQCLLSLELLLHKGLQSLPSRGQCPGFYQCILDSPTPANIPHGENSKFYSRLLSKCIDEPPEGEAVDVAAEIEPVLGGLDGLISDTPVASVGGIGTGPAVRRGRGRAGQQRRGRQGRFGLDPVDNVLWGSVPIAQGAPSSRLGSSSSTTTSGRRDGSSSPTSNSSSSSSSDSSSVPLRRKRSHSCSGARKTARHSEPHVVGSASHPTASRSGGRDRRQARAVVDCVEGVQVTQDTHSEVGAPDYYERFCVQCPIASHGSQCAKRRNIGIAQTAHFGAKEPLAFLGVWLRKGASCSDRVSHIACRPTLSEVEQYMREHQWLR